jgi:hypothetical protein
MGTGVATSLEAPGYLYSIISNDATNIFVFGMGILSWSKDDPAARPAPAIIEKAGGIRPRWKSRRRYNPSFGNDLFYDRASSRGEQED